jgi:hypothetical protein
MKIAPKLILCAVLSISIGIAAAGPLLASELNIRPWTDHIQGPTANFDIDVVYANFTIQNPDAPITETTGPQINYFAVIKATNPSDQDALMVGTGFMAAQQIANTTGQAPFGVKGNWSTGSGYEAKGAMVDGVWYNVTYTNGQYPFVDSDGKLTQSPFSVASQGGQWMEGVQIYQYTRHTEGGAATTCTYMNMNGTWTDVTGRITVDLPQNGPTYGAKGIVAEQQVFYQKVDPDSFGTLVDIKMIDGTNTTTVTKNTPNMSEGYTSTRTIDTDVDAFSNRYGSGESRLIIVTGTWTVTSNWVSLNGNGFINPVEVIRTGSIQTKTSMHTVLDVNPDLGDNTFLDTWTDATVIQQLTLTHIGNSYIYNTALSDNQQFSLDQYGAEAFIIDQR